MRWELFRVVLSQENGRQAASDDLVFHRWGNSLSVRSGRVHLRLSSCVRRGSKMNWQLVLFQRRPSNPQTRNVSTEGYCEYFKTYKNFMKFVVAPARLGNRKIAREKERECCSMWKKTLFSSPRQEKNSSAQLVRCCCPSYAFSFSVYESTTRAHFLIFIRSARSSRRKKVDARAAVRWESLYGYDGFPGRCLSRSELKYSQLVLETPSRISKVSAWNQIKQKEKFSWLLSWNKQES